MIMVCTTAAIASAAALETQVNSQRTPGLQVKVVTCSKPSLPNRTELVAARSRCRCPRAYHPVQSNAAQPDALRLNWASNEIRLALRVFLHIYLLVVLQLFLSPHLLFYVCFRLCPTAYLNKLVPALLPLSITLSALIVVHGTSTLFLLPVPLPRSSRTILVLRCRSFPSQSWLQQSQSRWHSVACAEFPCACSKDGNSRLHRSATSAHRYLHTSNAGMAYADARFGYQRTQPESALDNKQTTFIDADSSTLLNHSVLEADIMQSPNDTFRKISFANGNGVLSPADSQTWDHPFASSLNPDPSPIGAPASFQEDNNVFLRHPNQHAAPYANQHQHSSWAFESGSGNSTPIAGAEFMPPPQYDGNHFIAQRSDGTHGSFAQQQSMPQHFIAAPQVQTPMSPHSHQDWMGMAERERESRPSNKRMRPNSPPRVMGDAQRRDGIRKKNGRIDIPQERNIQNIEDLIEQASDEEMVKELKQQKRLLRNREAA